MTKGLELLVGAITKLFGSILASIGLLSICAATSMAQSVDVAVVRYKHVGGEDNNHFYPIAVLRAALKATEEEFGAFQEVPYSRGVSRKREFQELLHGDNVNVLWAAEHDELENGTIAVRYPIYRGLLGCRVFVIHKDTQAIFSAVESAEDLRELVSGQGDGWRDVAIMRTSGLSVITVPRYPALFGMLAAKRFDYLPRSIGEAEVDLARARAVYPELVIERDLVLTYPMPVYFYVNRQFPELAERLAIGLSRIAETGQWETIWNKYHGNLLPSLGLDRRRVIAIENPSYPGQLYKPYWQ